MPKRQDKTPALLFAHEDAGPRELVQRYSQHETFRLLMARNGKEALKLARREKPAIVMASVTLPGARGPDVCAEARALREPQPAYAVLLVPRKGGKKGIQISTVGIDDFLLTPFARDEYFSRVRNALRLLEVEGELAASQSNLFRAEKLASLGVMAGGIAHEFNNIFGAIVGYCELALDHGGTDQMRKALQVTLESAGRATSITRNLLGFAREREPSISAVDLRECLDRVLTIMGPGLRKRGIRVQRAEEAVAPVRGDSSQLEQVILNVVQNAQHAMERGGALTVSLGPSPRRAMVRLKISDTGIGMSKDQVGRVFEPFYTTKGAYGQGSGQGTGLGLSVVHGIVEAHKGNVSLESTPGQGTTLIIDLPTSKKKAPSAEADRAKAARELVAELPSVRSLKILAVDDEPRILEVLEDMLATLGHSIDVAASVDEAVARFRKKTYDLVFTDVVMPGKDGWQLLEEFKALRPDVPMVFVTGSIGDNTAKRAKQVGAVGCIFKPFRMGDVKKALAGFAKRYPKKAVALRLPPELDRETCDALSAAILPRLARSKSDLELDIADVGYLSSYGVAFLLKVYSELNKGRRKLTLSNVSEHVFEILELTGLAGGGLEGLVVRRRVYGEDAPPG
jgi:anti-anti-sigma factor